MGSDALGTERPTLTTTKPRGFNHLLTWIIIWLICPPLAGCFFENVVPDSENQGRSMGVRPQPAAVEVPVGMVFEQRALFAGIPDKIGHHAATVTAFADGELLAAWYSYVRPDELAGSAIYMASRRADADEWTPPRLHIDRLVGDGNPVLYSEGDEVWLFQAVVPFGWSTAHIEVQRSHDRGRAWCTPKTIPGPLGSNVRNPAVRTDSGELLLPAYDDFLMRSLFFVSPDGDGWTLRSAIYTATPYQNIQPSVVPLSNGRLLAIMRNAGGGWLWSAHSNDGGRSWSEPKDSGFRNPGSAAMLLRLQSGSIVLFFNDSETERRPLSVAISEDDGQTWSPGKIIADGDSKYSYPAAAQSPDGLIHLLYTHDRQSIQHVTLSETWIVSP